MALSIAVVLTFWFAAMASGVTFERSIPLSTAPVCDGRLLGYLPAFSRSRGELTSVSIRVNASYYAQVEWMNYGVGMNTMELFVQPSAGINGFNSYNPTFPDWGIFAFMEQTLTRTVQPNERVGGYIYLHKEATISIEDISLFYSDQMIRGYSTPPSEYRHTLTLKQTGDHGEVSVRSYCEPRLSASVHYEYQPFGIIPEAKEYGFAFSGLLLISAVSRKVLRHQTPRNSS